MSSSTLTSDNPFEPFMSRVSTIGLTGCALGLSYIFADTARNYFHWAGYKANLAGGGWSSVLSEPSIVPLYAASAVCAVGAVSFGCAAYQVGRYALTRRPQ